tara:strand:+ start:159 stop:764 length:606 start_codon:yes stop_codon:yes gene_type:complete
MEVDFKDFFKAVERYERETRHDFPTSLNKSMASLLYKSPNSVIKKTPKTTKAKILKSLTGGKKKGNKGDMFARIATKSLRKKGRRISHPAVAAEMKTIYNRRVSAIGYVKSGWQPAAAKFGASKIKPPIPGTIASKGDGKAATIKELEAFALNAVGANMNAGEAQRKSYAAVQSAVDSETAQLVKFLNGDFKKANRKYGGR